MKDFKCKTFPCSQREWMNESEAEQHLLEHPHHEIYDVRTDLARQYACDSVAEFDELGRSLVESGANEVALPSCEVPCEL